MAALYLLLALLSLLCHSLVVQHSSATEEKVTALPGLDGELPFEMYTGYITVNQTTDNNLFYYFVKSESKPEEDPLILWLTGGPACSGFTSLAYEIGPLRFEWKEYNGTLPGLYYSPFRLTKNASVIFLDSPSGTGFSYSSVSLTEYKTGDYKTVREAYIFLMKWFENHQEFLSNPFFIAGDSYGGVFVPLLATRVADGIDNGTEPVLNLKGYFVGNPVTDKIYDATQVPFYHAMSFIDEGLYKAAEESCRGRYDIYATEECEAHIDEVEEMVSDINKSQVLEFDCGDTWAPRPPLSSARRRSLRESQAHIDSATTIPPIACRGYGYYLGYLWLNSEIVRDALHIRKDTVGEWVRCNAAVNYTKEVTSTILYHRNLTTRGYPALIYSGDHDSLIPTAGTHGWIKTLNYSVVDPWRPWFFYSQVAGFTVKYENNLTFATVKAAGHTTPEYKPRESISMFLHWVHKQPF
ncbi:serine carboxypeptidase-like 18 [Nymphaea colorata]|nr:serine carboxypeptidase-like 18 [Nymphaea colorata]